MTSSNVCLRFAENDGARTASDVWARAAHVRAFRVRAWQRPAAPPPPAPPSPPKVSAPVVLTLPARSEAVPGRVAVRLVLEVTAAHFGLPIDHLLADIRTRPLVRARWVAFYVARKLTARSLPFIANKMGRRDHTTILYGARAIQALIDARDAETIAAVNAIVGKLTGGAND